MKLLLLHNFYGSRNPSGENVVFELERDLLVGRGHDVQTLVRHSDRLIGHPFRTIMGAFATPWNPFAARAVRREVEAFRPDLVHAHNTFPLLSPAVFPAVGGRAARVLTLHNYRLFCPAAIPVRAGNTCTECLDRRSVLPAVRHGCYRGSRVATVPLALKVAIARAASVWDRHVDAFLALTEFQREMMVKAGLPAERVFVKPNFYPGRPEPRPWSTRQPRAVFVGRLSDEKGVAHLIDAWAGWGAAAPELRIVGDGPGRPALEARALTGGTNVRFLGQVTPVQAQEEIASARLLVLPSVWFEGFPLVLREAFALGTPAAVSDIGPLPALVGHGRAGVVFRPRDASSILANVRRVWESPGELERLARAARSEFEQHYGEDPNYALLVRIYERAIEARRNRRRRP